MLFLHFAAFSFSWRLERIPTRQLRIFHQRSFFFFCMGKLSKIFLINMEQINRVQFAYRIV